MRFIIDSSTIVRLKENAIFNLYWIYHETYVGFTSTGSAQVNLSKIMA